MEEVIHAQPGFAYPGVLADHPYITGPGHHGHAPSAVFHPYSLQSLDPYTAEPQHVHPDFAMSGGMPIPCTTPVPISTSFQAETNAQSQGGARNSPLRSSFSQQHPSSSFASDHPPFTTSPSESRPGLVASIKSHSFSSVTSTTAPVPRRAPAPRRASALRRASVPRRDPALRRASAPRRDPAPRRKTTANNAFPMAEAATTSLRQTKPGRTTSGGSASGGSSSSSSSSDAAVAVAAAPGHNTFLERNRLAASKCRQKKKVRQHELEETKDQLEMLHRSLRAEYDSLMSEVTQIKNFLVSHARCSDPNIDSWIREEAHRFVKRSAERPQSPLLEAWQEEEYEEEEEEEFER